MFFIAIFAPWAAIGGIVALMGAETVGRDIAIVAAGMMLVGVVMEIKYARRRGARP
jgi:hypothetical protein